MKMGGFFFSGLFWGILLVLFGLSVIARSVLNIDLPLVRIFIAGVLILWGISIISGRPFFRGGRWDEGRQGSSTTVFSDTRYEEGQVRSEYNAIFGQSRVDLRTLEIPAEGIRIDANAIFGSLQIRLPDDRPVRVKADAAFGSVNLPDGQVAAFGDREWVRSAGSGGAVEIDATGVFGSVQIQD